MKFIKGLFFTTLLALFCYSAPAQQAVFTPFNLASSLMTISNATATSTASTLVPIRGGARDIAIWQQSVASDSGVSNAVCGFNLTPDGTNYTTTFPISTTVTLNGTNPVLSVTVINHTNLTGSVGIRPDKTSTTQTNFVTTKIWISYDN